MIKLILFVVAVAIFGAGFIAILINQLSSATNIIMNLYNSNDWFLKIAVKLAVFFNMKLYKLFLEFILFDLFFQKHYIVRKKYMKKILSGFLVLPILFVSFFSLSAFFVLEKHEVKNETVRQKRSLGFRTDFKINEEDFINTMFLRSSFFENGSDTNYFVNPTLKTSKSLTYNENGYLDFLKYSYATGIVFDKPSDKFLELYKNGDNYVKQYKLNRFYNVDKKIFLERLNKFYVYICFEIGLYDY